MFSCQVSESGSLRSGAGSVVLVCVNVSLRIHSGVFAASDKAMRQIFDDREGNRNKNQTDSGREEHTADHDGAKDATRSGAPVADVIPNGRQPKIHARAVITIGRKRKRAAPRADSEMLIPPP